MRLITQRSQVQILPPLQVKSQVRGPFDLRIGRASELSVCSWYARVSGVRTWIGAGAGRNSLIRRRSLRPHPLRWGRTSSTLEVPQGDDRSSCQVRPLVAGGAGGMPQISSHATQGVSWESDRCGIGRRTPPARRA